MRKFGISPSNWEYESVDACEMCGQIVQCYRISPYNKRRNKNKKGWDFNRII